MSMIDTPEGIAAFGWLQVIHALALEINTSMKLSRGVNLMKVVQSRGYTGPVRGTKPNQRLALKWAIEQLQTINPDYVASGTVARALEETA